jgi:hypothetical protein
LRNDCEEYRMQAKKEFEILNGVNHPKIAKMHELYENQSKNTLYFVMDLC